MAATLLVLAACGDDSGSSASTGGAGTSVASSGGSGDTAAARAAAQQWFGRRREHDRRGDDRGDDHHTINPTVPDSQAVSSLFQTAVQMKFLAAALREGQATPDAYQKVFTDWDVYDGTIQKKNPQAWQTMTGALTAMQSAVTAKDVAAANAAARFEAASNAYLGSG
jgi:hypothetical protein